MRRKSVVILGNLLMGLGLISMLGGMAYAILSQLPALNLPEIFAHGSVMGIFVGAFLWLVGVCLSGRERVTDRYWLARHYNKCYTRNTHLPRH